MKKRFLPMLLLMLMGVAGNLMTMAQTPEPSGQWKFDDPSDLMAATVGNLKLSPLVIGSGSVSPATVDEASIEVADGPKGGRAILVPAASALKVERAEGAKASTSYTFMLDMMVLNAYAYDGLFQTNSNNSNDGDLFISKHQIGMNALGGYFGSLRSEFWNRIVLTNSDGAVKVYVNGEKVINRATTDGRWEIDPWGFYLLCDEDGEKVDTYVSEVAFWETPLTDDQVAEMGGIGDFPWITDVSQIEEGGQYYILSDRIKFAGSTTGKPKAMACLQDNFKINWGDHYVYWGDLDKEADGFIWTAEKVGDQWAFLNKEKGKYLGNMNDGESDVIFSEDAVGYTLTDLREGEGCFFMTNSESVHSPHVQGYLRSDRSNNSLAKQNVGDDNYSNDVATAGYPGRWRLIKANQGDEPQSEFFNVTNGYYNIVGSNAGSSEKNCWTEYVGGNTIASLIWSTLRSGDPFSTYRIEAVDKEKGQYTIRNYVTEKYVGGTTQDNKVTMTDEPATLTFRTVQGNRKALYICNAAGDTLFVVDSETEEIKHIFARTNTYNDLDTWKLQKVDAKQLESPSGQLRLELARKVKEVDTSDHSSLSAEQIWVLGTLRNKAYEAVVLGAYDIMYERYLSDLDAAMKGEYTEPVYNKYQKNDLRVLSYNVRHCAGNDGSLNLPRTAKVIAAQNADVVALQEVDSAFSSRSDYKYQVKELSEATGMYGIFCSALTGYGIGILSKQLPLSVRVVALTSDFEPRRMLIAEYDNYVFASLHVGLSASARRGTGPIIKAEAERWVETGKPLIIAGDFNDDGTDEEMQGARGVLTEYLQQNGFTYHSDLTTPTWSDGVFIIDNIISYDPIGGVEKVSYEVVNDKVTSDHMPIKADLIVGFEDPNGIGSLTPNLSPVGEGSIYDLGGRRTNGQLPDSIYIIDGKKVLRK
ncbi:MAG: endonuclease/exonuclease/phosphatase family protein [Bacteroidaceae bacterium]|nr:endonuclease/exonuclease/phosphatase family protein [Bacteroidaceae bacterium]